MRRDCMDELPALGVYSPPACEAEPAELRRGDVSPAQL